MSGFRGRKFRSWMEVAGTEVEIIQFGADFELNTIPSATAVCALGRNVKDQKPAAIHQLVKTLRMKQPVKVWLQMDAHGERVPPTVDVNDEDPPAGEKTLIFDGYTSGPAYQRRGNAASFSIALEGWLADLAYSSCLSASTHPSTPADLAFPVVLRLLNPNLASSTQPGAGMTGPSLAQAILAPNVVEDLWGNGILPWFKALASDDHVASVGGAFAALLKGGPNRAALAALERMKPGIPGTVPLKFDLGGAGAAQAQIVSNIQSMIARQTFETLFGYTMWDNLVGMASNFMFAVSPGIADAMVVPMIPTLNDHMLTIYDTEYDDIALSGASQRTLKAVALFGSKDMDGGPPMAGNGVPLKDVGVGGVYSPAGVKEGLVIAKQAPEWLGGLAYEAYTSNIKGPNDLVVPVAPAPGGGGLRGPDPALVIGGLNQVLNKFARAMYGFEVLKFRQGQLVGKFRTDIRPGSIVRIECASDRFIEVIDQFGEELFAAVNRVSLYLDAEGSKASTTFGLAHNRGRDENASPDTSMESHPLYATKWKGYRLRGQSLDFGGGGDF